jgi:FkbM family methyltransferase
MCQHPLRKLLLMLLFAGMPMNQVLLRHSLCDNPELMPRISLFATGLGEANKDCTVVSSVSNTGNGNVICSADVQAAMMDLSTKEIGHHYVVSGDGRGTLEAGGAAAASKHRQQWHEAARQQSVSQLGSRRTPHIFPAHACFPSSTSQSAVKPCVVQVRGTMSLRPLDDLLSEDVHLLKLDVEGFEESVLKGAKQLLSSKRVKYLITEANNNLRKREGCVEYVK